ncbi:hypothetical protein ISCGN_000209 [Ixodes scapularis]
MEVALGEGQDSPCYKRVLALGEGQDPLRGPLVGTTTCAHARSHLCQGLHSGAIQPELAQQSSAASPQVPEDRIGYPRQNLRAKTMR